MKELVRLRMRPSRDGKSFRYMLDYVDHDRRRRQVSMGHADKRKAERQRQEKELELRVNVSGPVSMKLTDFFRDSLARTQGQVRATTLDEMARSMKDFVECVGDINVQEVRYEQIQEFRRIRQWSVERGRSPLAKFCHHFNKIRKLAGIETTEHFYLAVRGDVVDRTRSASEASRKDHSVARLLRASGESDETEELPCASPLPANA